MSNPETKLQRTLLEYLLLRGIFAWRNNSGFVRIGKRMIELAPAGSPDLIGILPGGRFLGVEVKMPGEAPSPVQVKFQAQMRAMGAAVFTVHSLSELIEVLTHEVNVWTKQNVKA